MKVAQLMAADRDMQLLADAQMQRHKDREKGLPDRSDDVLDDFDLKIVSVEWFDALEGIDE